MLKSKLFWTTLSWFRSLSTGKIKKAYKSKDCRENLMNTNIICKLQSWKSQSIGRHFKGKYKIIWYHTYRIGNAYGNEKKNGKEKCTISV